ncbi:hypothetical protein BN844_5362 [Pseudomonas sp. SHC52]|nr:hypothetical protein BN844_5362 [Pseudomonas sp. SHC52]
MPLFSFIVRYALEAFATILPKNHAFPTERYTPEKLAH